MFRTKKRENYRSKKIELQHKLSEATLKSKISQKHKETSANRKATEGNYASMATTAIAGLGMITCIICKVFGLPRGTDVSAIISATTAVLEMLKKYM